MREVLIEGVISWGTRCVELGAQLLDVAGSRGPRSQPAEADMLLNILDRLVQGLVLRSLGRELGRAGFRLRRRLGHGLSRRLGGCRRLRRGRRGDGVKRSVGQRVLRASSERVLWPAEVPRCARCGVLAFLLSLLVSYIPLAWFL